MYYSAAGPNESLDCERKTWDELLKEPADMSSVAKSGTDQGGGEDPSGLKWWWSGTSLYFKQNL